MINFIYKEREIYNINGIAFSQHRYNKTKR